MLTDRTFANMNRNKTIGGIPIGLIQAHLALIGVNLLYGGNYVVAKEATPEYILPFGFIFVRASIGMILFFAFHFLLSRFFLKKDALLAKAIEKSDRLRLMACGLFGVTINQLLFIKGLSLTAPINASLIMITTPILVLLLAALIIGEKITRYKALGVLLGAAGAALVIIYGQNTAASAVQSSSFGDLLVMINACSYGLYLVIVKPLMSKYHPITIIKWVFFWGFLFAIPFSYPEFSQTDWERFPTYVWWAVVYVVIGATFFTYLLNIFALQKVNASVVSSYIYTQPVIATCIAVALGKDELSWIKILGGLLIFAGVYLVSARFGGKEQQPV